MIRRPTSLLVSLAPLALVACIVQQPPQQGAGYQQQPAAGQPGQGADGQPAAGQPAASCPPVQPAAGTTDAQIVQLFTQSAWCHYSYSGTSGGGTEKSERVVMTMDGRIASTSSSESSHSGTNSDQYGEQTQAWGTASASADGNQGCWKVENGQLHLSDDGAQWQPVPTQITQNSSGYPIVNAGGKEYASCN